MILVVAETLNLPYSTPPYLPPTHPLIYAACNFFQSWKKPTQIQIAVNSILSIES